MRLRLRTYFLAGLLALIPLVVTVGILSWLFNVLDGFLGPYLYEWLGRPVPGLGLVATLVVVLAIGMIATNFAGRRVLAGVDIALQRIPLVRTIYSTVKQMSMSLLQGGQDFQHVVLVEYPRRGLYQIGFVTGKIEGPLQEELTARVGERVLNVFVPATPNPMSGYLVMLPERDIHFLPMSVQDGLKLVISGGLAIPAQPRQARARRGAAS
ncbi:MAG: DUF502 domain-containing protein [Bacillati bacterium ANGP1]|uniref:DUF502 domain-containing protein n=1 Tax=Candidatus Segetimicrobium genomatis TaxID=2569760 RepID=A0A537JM60_9BACT|nr:MAG: DUF502 domain-containing protein [Terrabacteria group bacterium ANGP1]